MNKVGMNSKLYLMLAGLVLIGAAWKGGEWINASRLSRLVVLEAPKVDIGGSNIDAKSFYPAWVKQVPALQDAGESDTSVDELFRAKAAKEKPQKPETNYLETFQQMARIDGLADNGVFVNGRFYKAKERMEALTIQGTSGEAIVPVVEVVSANKIVFRVGGETLTIQKR